MLYQIGPLKVKTHPFNIHEFGRSSAADYAAKDVVGAEPPLEFVGLGPHEMSISGRLFPHSLGGMNELETLYSMLRSGRPHYIARGDGAVIGWWVVTNVQEKGSYLDAHGIGRQIEVSISLRRASAPSPLAFFSIMSSII